MDDNTNRRELELKIISQSYSLYFQRVSQENMLINNRTSWLITIQSFMIAGISVIYSYYMQTFVYAIISNYNNHNIDSYHYLRQISFSICNFMLFMCIIGGVISVIVAFLVWTASQAIESLENEWNSQGLGQYGIEGSLIKLVPTLTNGNFSHSNRIINKINTGKYLSIAIPVLFSILWIFLFIAINHTRIKV